MYRVRIKSEERVKETKASCRQSLHGLTTSGGEDDRVQDQPGLRRKMLSK